MHGLWFVDSKNSFDLNISLYYVGEIDLQNLFIYLFIFKMVTTSTVIMELKYNFTHKEIYLKIKHSSFVNIFKFLEISSLTTAKVTMKLKYLKLSWFSDK